MSTIKTTATLIQKGLPAIKSVPLNPYAPVAKWLLGTSAVVGGIVHVGGITRLTKSGLSMTDWKPLGSLPPITQNEWETEFERYKQFPEWLQRQSMTLEEFQYIYFWEWGHRMLGRTVGLCFALPWGYFALRGMIPRSYSNRMKVLFAMGGTQGLVGWWMVKSGLGEDRRGDRKEIRVTPYRLATHLTMAVSTYSLLLWTSLGIFHHPNDSSAMKSVSPTSKVADLAKSLSQSALMHAKRIRTGSIGVTSLTALTIVSGAFVAGNDAGCAYNTFPQMDGEWIPFDDIIDPDLQPPFRNAFENTATVQWCHRVLGTSTALSAITVAGALMHPAARGAVTPQVKKGLQFMGATALGQMSLGIATLINYVPIELAAAHQLGSLAVLTSGIFVVHSIRYVNPAVLRTIGARVVSTPSGYGGTSLAISGKTNIAMKMMK